VFSGQTGNLIYELSSPNEVDSGQFGASVSMAGDINHDGFVDVLIGATGEGVVNPESGDGRAYVFDGSTGQVLTQTEYIVDVPETRLLSEAYPNPL
jgi:hypothetical protein